MYQAFPMLTTNELYSQPNLKSTHRKMYQQFLLLENYKIRESQGSITYLSLSTTPSTHAPNSTTLLRSVARVKGKFCAKNKVVKMNNQSSHKLTLSNHV